MPVTQQDFTKQQSARPTRWVLAGLLVLAAWEMGQYMASYLMLTVIAPNYPLTLMGDLPLEHLLVFLLRSLLALGLAALIALPGARFLLRSDVIS